MAYGLKLEINDRVLRADLHVLEMRDFDIILGIDWLSGNHAAIRCHDHEVEFDFSGEPKLIFYGARTRSTQRIITAMKPMKLLEKRGYQGFLVSIVELMSTRVQVSDVPVVNRCNIGESNYSRRYTRDKVVDNVDLGKSCK
ncbi:hypothetical protein C2S52_007242 [Perilla frutescens var. hirtella]|nr:hypothetical protein C2S51_008634 [Perilla frutescens var. frutescens]KAH6787690.1 hypothetical protein C2S52_007242 [Perilla frutescens var. hirtella]